MVCFVTEELKMNYWFIAAAVMSAFTGLLHLFVGGPETVPALLAVKDLRKMSKFTTYYCWHLVSITLFGIAIAFFIAARDATETTLAVFATTGAGMFAAWSLTMIAIFRLKKWHFPQWALFLPSMALGIAGLLA